MLPKFILSLALIFVFFLTNAQTAQQRVEQLMEQRDWFALEEEYPVLQDSINSPVLKGFTEMLLKSYFNVLPGVMESIHNLLANYQGQLGSKVVDVLICESQMLARMGYYGDAADRMKELIHILSPSTPKENMKDLFVFADYYDRLRQVERYWLRRPDKDIEIPFTLEKVGHRGMLMFIPVNIHGTEYKFIFDTGARGMFLSQRLSEKLGLTPVTNSPVTGSVGEVMGNVTTIDSIEIGGVVFRNPLIHTVPPDPSVDTVYQLDAILGSDFMNLMGEFQIYPNEKKLVFPVKQTPLPAMGRNMMVENGQYYVKGYSGDERVKMLFDSGSVDSEMSLLYYKKHQARIDQKSRRDSIPRGGIGGYEMRQVLQLDSIPFRIGNVVCPLKNISVNPDKNEVYQLDEDGLLGMSFICSFSKVVVNYREMFILVE